MKRTTLGIGLLAAVCGDLAIAKTYIGGSYAVQTLSSDSSFNVGLVQGQNIGNNQVALGGSINAKLASVDNLGNLFLGYEWNFNQWVLSLEGDASYNSATLNASTNITIAPYDQKLSVFDTELTVKETYGLSILPGHYLTKDLLIFGRLGINRSKIRVTTNSLAFSAEDDYYKTGTRFGIGGECFVNQNLSLRLEYSYIRTNGRTIAENGGTIFVPGNNGNTFIPIPVNTTYTRPQQYLFNFGLKYRF